MVVFAYMGTSHHIAPCNNTHTHTMSILATLSAPALALCAAAALLAFIAVVSIVECHVIK